jgi:6-phosphogluconolactonase (cycloisomerase 2 family)
MFTINPTTGVLTSIGKISAGGDPTAVTIDPTGKFAYVANQLNNVSIYRIDALTGALSAVGISPAGLGPMSLAIDPTGKFAYAGDISSNNLVYSFNIDANTGLLMNTGSVPAGGIYPYPVIVEPAGKFAFGANIDSNNVSIFSIDSETGKLTAAGSVATTTSPGALYITTTIQ